MTPEEHKIMQAYRSAVDRLLTSATNPGRAASVLSDNKPGSVYHDMVLAGYEVDALLHTPTTPRSLGVDLAAEGSDRTAHCVVSSRGVVAVGCEGEDGLLRIHAEDKTCEVCAQATYGSSSRVRSRDRAVVAAEYAASWPAMLALRHPPKMIIESNPGTPLDPRNAHSTADVVDRLGRLRGDMTKAIETLVGDLSEHYQRGGDAVVSRAQAFDVPGGTGSSSSEPQEPCGCWTCSDKMRRLTTFIVCSECGNKRCPKATNHLIRCTGSNEPGQAGSRYTRGT